MKIPREAHKVFAGKIFDVYQWEQKMFDGSYQTFEMVKRANTVEVIAVAGDKILLTHQSQPNKLNFYSLFSGRMEPGEEPLKAAQRELLEEGGLASDDWMLLKTFQPESKIEWEIYTFIARDCKKIADQSLDIGERIEVVSYTFDEFISLLFSDGYWGRELSLEVARMKEKGTLADFKRTLFQ